MTSQKFQSGARTVFSLISPFKSVTILFHKTRDVLVLVNNAVIKQVDNHKHLGIVLNKTLSWSDHINEISTEAMKRVIHSVYVSTR